MPWQALERRSLPLVKLLRDRYGPLLELDPTLGDLLDTIEAVGAGAWLALWCGRGLAGKQSDRLGAVSP